MERCYGVRIIRVNTIGADPELFLAGEGEGGGVWV